jgi:hypothetical protein
MFLLLLASHAFAGDLVVSTAVPAAVRVDGVILAGDGRSAVVQGLTGVHAVEILSPRGRLVAATNVDIPRRGQVTLGFDGRSLSLLDGRDRRDDRHDRHHDDRRDRWDGSGRGDGHGRDDRGPREMSAAEFDRLMGSVDGAWFSSDRVQVVQLASAQNYFTVDQVGRLVETVPFSSDRLAIVRACHDHVLDPQNAYALQDHFTFSSDRDAAMQLFGAPARGW